MGYINLNKKSFFNNLDYFSKICSKDKISIALKDNAYGHGILEIGKMCQEYGIKHVFVRNIDEANKAKQFNFESILVLYDIPAALDDDIVISINSIGDIKKIPKKSKIELKLDTGMHRNGISEDEIDLALEEIFENDLIINGIFTHFCCSDENNDITSEQEKKFQTMLQQIRKKVTYNFRIHCANSHGVFRVDMSRYDLARIGIGAYGYLDIEDKKYLKPVLSLYANKISTKKISIGDHIGYGSSAYIAKVSKIISNYDVGYADGFLRLSENKKSTIQDGRAIFGRISMDSFFVEGNDDTVCVFSDVDRFAKLHNTISYEILALLNPFIKRYEI